MKSFSHRKAVAGAREAKVVELPDQRQTKRIVKLGFGRIGKLQIFKPADEPCRTATLVALCGMHPVAPRNTGFNITVFFEQWDPARPGCGHGAYFVVIVPINAHSSGNMTYQPARYIKAK